MSTVAENNKRIAKNTFFLYIRMFLIMAVSLYTSRVILQTLGVEDFGIYNVVAGIVVLFSFINGAMAIASQRFLSFALGKQDDKEVNRVFSMSLTSHLAIAAIVIAVAETVGLWLLCRMNFPEERLYAVGWVYQIAILTCCVNIVRVPYNAAIIAYEKMSFYAWVSIIECVLKLVIVYLLLIYSGDKLIFYSLLLLAVTIIVNLAYKFYCTRQFTTIRYRFFWNAALFKEFLGFSGWSLAGSLANVGAQQGLNMIINVFCGVVVNAAVGISNQVMGAVAQFLGNFQTAFNPQLVKSYATGDREYFMNLIFKSSKFSYYLMLLIALPVLINCEFFLQVWLGEVPQYAVEFSQLMILFLLFDAISGPLWIAVQATGEIRNYQILMGVLILLNIPVALVLMYMGYSPVYIFVGRVVINILTLAARILYLKPLIQLPSHQFVIKVIGVITMVTALAVPLPLYLHTLLPQTWWGVIANSGVCVLMSGLAILLLGLTCGERAMVVDIVKHKVLHR